MSAPFCIFEGAPGLRRGRMRIRGGDGASAKRLDGSLLELGAKLVALIRLCNGADGE